MQTKEEVASTLEAVQNIQTMSQALQKSKENYVSKTLEQERMRKEGATQRDVEKVLRQMYSKYGFWVLKNAESVPLRIKSAWWFWPG